MIKDFIFDMGQVLVDFNIRAFADRYDISEEDKALLLDLIFEGNADWALCDWGYMTEDELAEKVCGLVPERLHEAARGMAAHWFEPIIPIPGMADVARRIKEAGYGLYLLSNAGSKHNYYWQFVPGHEYFDGVVASANEKLVKPQPEIYRLCLDRFGLKADECLFTDDRETNLAGAEVCGIHTVIFRGREDFLRRIAQMGIVI